MNKKSLYAVSGSLAALAVFGFFALIFSPNGAQAGLEKTWLTIDANELNQMREIAGKKNKALNVDVVRVENGIAVIRADEEQIAQISTYAHENFHKCGGFVAHSDEADAVGTIANMARPAAPAVTYTINNAPVAQPLINGLIAANIAATITHLSTNYNTRYYKSPDGVQSATWIRDRWRQFAGSRSDVTVEFFNHPNWAQPSVIMTVRGSAQPSEVVVLGAHQDSIRAGCSDGGTCLTLPAPGADDDASGIASLTEFIRVAMAKNYVPAKTVKFMAYAGEERGLLGSREIAANYQANGVNVVGVMQLDMTAYKYPSTDIAIITDYTDAAQNQFLRDLAAAYLPNLTVVDSACGYGCSDHAAWYSRGFAASFPFEAPFGSTDNPYIHTENDTLANSDATGEHSLKFSKLAAAYTAELAKGTFLTLARPPREKIADFDGDDRADISVYRPSEGTWYISQSSNGSLRSAQFGTATDRIVPADYDADGKTDLAVYREGKWFILQSRDNSFRAESFGIATDKPLAKDFDGDGRADLSVWRDGNWYVLQSLNGKFTSTQFGLRDDIPVPGDYDGDGLADFAVYRPTDGTWYLQRSEAGFTAAQFGIASDKPVPTDYDGDGKIDIAVYRNGTWYVNQSLAGFAAMQFGTATDVPAPADYDGDGKADIAVYRNGNWYSMQTAAGFNARQFGTAADKSAPAAFMP